MNESENRWRNLGSLGGLGILGWTLVFPFYGPLASRLLQEQAGWATHAFVLGLAVGYALCAWPGRRILLPVGVSSLVAVILAAASSFSPWIFVTAILMMLSGVATAGPTLAWAAFLAETKKRILPFVVGVVGANLLCYTATVTVDSFAWNYGLAAMAAVLFISVSMALDREDPGLTEDAPQPWIFLWPLLLFILASSYVGGLLYGAIIPAVEGWAGLGWLSFWPYILAFIIAGLLASRRYELLPAVTLSIYGLALLPLTMLEPGAVAFHWLASFVSIMIGAAFADAFIWLALIYLASQGHPRVIASGLALNVLTIWAVSVLSDLALLRSPDRMPIASLLSAALLFVLIPIIIARLAPSRRPEPVGRQPADSVDILEWVSRPEIVATLTDAEKRVCGLVLMGKTNREIAEALFISINTVKYHVRNVLRKSSCANRKALTAKLVPDGIGTAYALPSKSLDR